MNPDIRRPKDNLLDLRPPDKKHPKKNIIRRDKTITIAASILIVLALLIVLIKTLKKEDLNSVTIIKSRVSKHMVLPKNEEPALATVTDTGKLTTPFLKQSINGDKLLVYQYAKKVIIYRPSLDRIIDVGPVSIAASQGQ